MKDIIIFYLPFLISVITITQLIMAGNKHPKAWLVGLGNQVLWSTWIITSNNWGLLPMNIAIWVIYARNHFKWKKQ